LSVGSVFLVHGLQKLFGLLGGPGISGTARLLASYGLHYSTPLAVAVGLVEFLGGVFLIVGAAAVWASVALLIDMALTVWKVHYPHGVALNGGLIPGHGHDAEFHLVLIGALLCLALGGPGALSIDGRRGQRGAAQGRAGARIRKV
jgi:putative oxidoreductase